MGVPEPHQLLVEGSVVIGHPADPGILEREELVRLRLLILDAVDAVRSDERQRRRRQTRLDQPVDRRMLRRGRLDATRKRAEARAPQNVSDRFEVGGLHAGGAGPRRRRNVHSVTASLLPATALARR